MPPKSTIPTAQGALVAGGFVCFLGLSLFPIVFGPMFGGDGSKGGDEQDLKQYYLKRQDEIRKFHKERGRNREDLQPGGMKVWSDPFDRKDDRPPGYSTPSDAGPSTL